MKSIDLCRTWLFLPGADRATLAAAPACGADALIQELEDFTPPRLRPQGRKMGPEVYAAWKSAGCVSGVRVNRLDEDGHLDLMAVMPGAPDIVFLPMVRHRDEVVALDAAVAAHETINDIPVGTTKLVPCIETAEGMLNANGILTATPRVVGALLAAEDMAKDLGAERGRDGIELFYVRQRFLVECRAAGVVPIDMPYTWADEAGAIADAEYSRRLGYGAKGAVRPDHIAGIKAVFTPSDEAITLARRTIDAFEAAQAEGKASVSVDGDLVEVPGYLSAKRLLNRAEALGVA